MEFVAGERMQLEVGDLVSVDEETGVLVKWCKSSEVFDQDAITKAIKDFLEYGEKSFRGVGHQGYFSGGGFAARVLRYHLEQLR